jgi:hypothetical protein
MTNVLAVTICWPGIGKSAARRCPKRQGLPGQFDLELGAIVFNLEFHLQIDPIGEVGDKPHVPGGGELLTCWQRVLGDPAAWPPGPDVTFCIRPWPGA